MPLSTTSPHPRASPARAAASACASGTLRGVPRTRRTTQYAHAPAQPSCTLSTRRVRAPGVARGAAANAAAGAAGRHAPCSAKRPAIWDQSGRAATVTPSAPNCSGRSAAAQPATTT